MLLVVTLSGIATSGKTVVVPTEVEHSLFKRPTSAAAVAAFLITLTGCDVEEVAEAEGGIRMAMAAAIIMLLPDKVYS